MQTTLRFAGAGPAAAQHGCRKMLDSCWHACALPAPGRVISELGRSLIIKPPGKRRADERVHVGLGSRIVARHIPLNKERSSTLKTAWGYFFRSSAEAIEIQTTSYLGFTNVGGF